MGDHTLHTLLAFRAVQNFLLNYARRILPDKITKEAHTRKAPEPIVLNMRSIFQPFFSLDEHVQSTHSSRVRGFLPFPQQDQLQKQRLQQQREAEILLQQQQQRQLQPIGKQDQQRQGEQRFQQQQQRELEIRSQQQREQTHQQLIHKQELQRLQQQREAEV